MAEGAEGSNESRRTVLIALGANAAIAVAKLAGGLISGSTAMLAEAAHSLADTVNQIFLLFSLAFGAREPDEDHPFGYGKERFFWSFLAAVFIFVSGALFSVYEGVHQLLAGEGEKTNYLVAYGVLAFALVAEGISLARAAQQVKGEAAEAQRSARSFVTRSKDPTTKTVLFEDTAAVAGVVLALIGVGLHQLTGDARWDALASIAIGVLLAFIAFALGRDTKALLIGEAALPEERQSIREVIERRDEVDAVLEVLTMAVGPHQLLVAVRLDLREGLESTAFERISNEIDAELREAVPGVHQVFLDATPRGTPGAADGRATPPTAVGPT